ncbi:hypothetical protein [Nannocystis pusilla]|uniref:hypothetical protein n=1 Tax=Nannocystis pusilla TaxID=889268 RepID=UPI003B7D03F8
MARRVVGHRRRRDGRQRLGARRRGRPRRGGVRRRPRRDGRGFADAWLRKYEAGGQVLWTDTFAGEFGRSDDATAIAAVAGEGFVAAGGTAVGEDDVDLWIRRYDADGEVVWTDVVAGMNGGVDGATDVAFTPDGGVVVTGTVTVAPDLNSDVWVRKYGP